MLTWPERRQLAVARLTISPFCDPAGSSLDSKKRLVFAKRRVESFRRLEVLRCYGNRYRGHDLKIHPGGHTPMLKELISRPITPAQPEKSTISFGPRRGLYINAANCLAEEGEPLDQSALEVCETFDLFYRTLCALMYNYAPLSGHPGGSISSGRFVARLIFDAMDYDLARPTRRDADMISYAAGHKALGLYAMWALRNEIARIAAPELLPIQERFQFRLEDLLGFRRNPSANTPLFTKFHAKALDGHPTPATPFVRLATGASGVGLAASCGLAWGTADLYGENAPRVHIIEGEGGMTPGRVAEALAAAGTASLDNIILHVDWNQASIDSNRVCREGETPGDYVQWTPAELAYLHDWNVVYVPDGFDWQQITMAQRSRSTCTTVSRRRSFIAQSKAGAMESRDALPMAPATAFARRRFSMRCAIAAKA